MKNSIFLLSLFILLFIVACDKSEPTDSCSSGFDQKAMFSNIADNLIIPGFFELDAQTTDLKAAVNNFIINPNATTLKTARQALQTARKTWQSVAQFSFGPAEEVFLANSVNNFPLNREEMIAKIESGSIDFSSPNDFDKGFPALEYLLYAVSDTDAAVADFYLNAENSTYLNYLKAVAEDIAQRVAITNTGWTAYADHFKNNTGTAAGTSLSQIINGLNQNYELIKREKLGIPSGVLTLGFPNSEKVEAPYSGISTELAKIALQASQDFYLGKTGVGLDDFLIETGNAELNQAIQSNFNSSNALLSEIGDELSKEVAENQDQVTEVYNDLTRNLVNLKTDMPSVLCVSITYIDNPSDTD